MFNTLIIFFGDYLIFFAIIPLVYFWYKDRKLFFKLVFAVALAKLVEMGIGHIFPTPRPYEVTGITPILRNMKGDPSFPSGHTSVVIAFAATIFLKYKKLGIVFLLLAVLIGVSRVIGGVHYPVDILGGIFVGAFSAFGVLLSGRVLEDLARPAAAATSASTTSTASGKAAATAG